MSLDIDLDFDLDFVCGFGFVNPIGLAGTEYDSCPNGEDDPGDAEYELLISMFFIPLPSKGIPDKKLLASSSSNVSVLISIWLLSPPSSIVPILGSFSSIFLCFIV